MDEKGSSLTTNHLQRVISKKGVKRVHIVASEHTENVTVVVYCNATGKSIPPMKLFRGKRLKPEFCENLPHVSLVKLAPKDYMTTECFSDFLRHFAQYKSNGLHFLYLILLLQQQLSFLASRYSVCHQTELMKSSYWVRLNFTLLDQKLLRH